KDIIQVLYKQGKSVQEIANSAGASRQTIYRHLKTSKAITSSKTSEAIIPKKLFHHQKSISVMLRKGISNGKKIYQTVREEGYLGSYSTLHRFLTAAEKEEFIKKYKTSNRYNTGIGE